MSENQQQFQIRPRFRIELQHSPENISRLLKEELNTTNSGIYGKVIDGHATLHLSKEDQHYWSPQLSLSYESKDDGSLLRGMYSPRPEVWTMFVLFYGIIGFASLVILVVGYSNWTLGQSVQILWAVPILLLLFLSLYLVSYFGQKMGRKQMANLHVFVEESLQTKITD